MLARGLLGDIQRFLLKRFKDSRHDDVLCVVAFGVLAPLRRPRPAPCTTAPRALQFARRRRGAKGTRELASTWRGEMERGFVTGFATDPGRLLLLCAGRWNALLRRLSPLLTSPCDISPSRSAGGARPRRSLAKARPLIKEHRHTDVVTTTPSHVLRTHAHTLAPTRKCTCTCTCTRTPRPGSAVTDTDKGWTLTDKGWTKMQSK